MIPARRLTGIWPQLYDDTHTLLGSHPGKPLRLAREGLRQILTPHLEINRSEPAKRRWEVDSDGLGLRLGDPFGLHRHIAWAGPEARDIAACLEGPSSPAVTLFDGCAASPAIASALLSVAALVEARIAPLALARGDFGAEEARKACGWASRRLGSEVQTPLVVRPKALLERLLRHLDGPEALSRADALNQGPRSALLIAARDVLSPPQIESWGLRVLRVCADPADPRMGRLRRDWRALGRSDAALRDLACRDPRGPRFLSVRWPSRSRSDRGFAVGQSAEPRSPRLPGINGLLAADDIRGLPDVSRIHLQIVVWRLTATAAGHAGARHLFEGSRAALTRRIERALHMLRIPLTDRGWAAIDAATKEELRLCVALGLMEIRTAGMRQVRHALLENAPLRRSILDAVCDLGSAVETARWIEALRPALTDYASDSNVPIERIERILAENADQSSS